MQLGVESNMKIIDAFWEKRNLSIEAMEFVVFIEDSKNVVSDILANEKQYNIVKVPVGKVDIMFELAANGYVFIESLIGMHYDLKQFKNVKLLPVQKRMLDSVTYAKMNDVDIDEMFVEIRGGLFFTDRIALDQYFPHGANGNRYVGWISDSLKKDSSAYKLIYKGKNIGFFVNREVEPHVYSPFLSGMYKDYQKSGLGISAIYYQILNSWELHGKTIITDVSSNNQAILKISLALGFTISHMQYVYVKHNN
jgi:hypothetical protein